MLHLSKGPVLACVTEQIIGEKKPSTQQDLNPWPLDDEVFALPRCHNGFKGATTRWQSRGCHIFDRNLDLENDATKWAPRISGKNCTVPKREPRTAARINFGRDRSFAVKFELLSSIKIPPYFCFWIINGRSIRPKAFQSNKKFIQKNISDEKFGSIFNRGQKFSKRQKNWDNEKFFFPPPRSKNGFLKMWTRI